MDKSACLKVKYIGKPCAGNRMHDLMSGDKVNLLFTLPVDGP